MGGRLRSPCQIWRSKSSVGCLGLPTVKTLSSPRPVIPTGRCRVSPTLGAAGCRAHVTVGGHYPSFDYGEVLQRIPGADSVVRFEGEATLVELMERLASGRAWRDLLGLPHP